MGLKDLFKKKEKSNGLTYAPTMGGNVPFYSAFGDNLYASDLVVQSIRCKANEFKKLDPRHIVYGTEGKQVKTDSSIAKMLRRPNDYMTTADFLEKATILLELNKNVFIYPQYYRTKGGEKVYESMHILKPLQVEYLADDKEVLYIKFYFANGYTPILPAKDIVHWRKDFGINDYFGGGMLGGNDDAGLLKMLKRYDQLTQSIAKAMQASCTINGVMRINSYMDDDTLKLEVDKFNERLISNESGIIATDLKTEYENIPRDVKLVDAETLKFFQETILRANGTSLAILNGDYTKSQKEAYYEHALEADIKSLGQAFTKCLFSDRELSYGNEVVLYPNNIVFMSIENKIAFAQVAAPGGMLLKDEFRELFGYPPLPDGQGQVIAQGYNALLDANNNNKLTDEEGGTNE